MLGVGLWATQSSVRTSLALPSDCDVDAQGNDDEPGQKDLNELCTEPGHEDFVSWNFDDTMWTGNNTGDGCALFDTDDADVFANYAVCVRLYDGTNQGGEALMLAPSPLIYQCTNLRVDRCTGAVLLKDATTSPATVCEVNLVGTQGGEDADPFAGEPTHTSNKCAGTGCTTDDALTVCDIDVADFGLPGGTVVTLTDVCSYPSGQPNSDPSDCVLTPPNDPCVGVDCSAFDTDCGYATCNSSTGQCTEFTPKPAATVCREAASVCDVAEVCDGINTGACPANLYAVAGTACGGSAADCDALDTCNGAGVCIDNVDPNTTLCRADAGACDLPEYCDGTTKVCPANAFESPGTACGGSAEDCDALDTCNAAGECVDNVDPNGTICRADAGVCDVAEVCDGTNKTCPVNAYEPAGTGCGGSDTDCDALDTCNATGECIDNVDPNTTVCRPDAGACDLPEYCDGTTKACPANAFESPGTACGGSAEDCDALDTCNAAGECIDNVDPNGTICRADAGVCDVAEVCDGTNKTCPTNQFEEEGTACGGSADDCDALDTCNATGECIDNVDPITTVCREDAGLCDVPEYCDGATKVCPADQFEEEGTACGGSAAECDALDTCDDSGQCVDNVDAAGTICREAAGDCDVAEECDGSSKTCPTDAFVPEGAACGDDSDTQCTDPDTCDGEGVCQPNNEPCGYVTDSSLCSFDVDPVLDGRQFRVIFSPNVQAYPSFKLNATNPGQYYYNAFVEGSAGQLQTVTLQIPWPFITQGAQPVHVYDAEDIDVDSNLCIREEGGGLPIGGESYPATITLNDVFSGEPKDGVNSAGHAFSVDCDPLQAAGALPNGQGYTCTVTLEVRIPDSELAYINIHLDYGVKGVKADMNPLDDYEDRYDAGETGASCGSYRDALKDQADNSGPIALATCTPYLFAHDTCIVTPDETCSDEVQNVNEFKKIKGAFGLVNTSSDGSGLAGLTVALVNPLGQIVATGLTDEDGYYALPYKHVGKASAYTVVLSYGDPPVRTLVLLKANGWAEASYDAATNLWLLDFLNK